MILTEKQLDEQRSILKQLGKGTTGVDLKLQDILDTVDAAQYMDPSSFLLTSAFLFSAEEFALSFDGGATYFTPQDNLIKLEAWFQDEEESVGEVLVILKDDPLDFIQDKIMQNQGQWVRIFIYPNGNCEEYDRYDAKARIDSVSRGDGFVRVKLQLQDVIRTTI